MVKASGMDEQSWDLLLTKIRVGKCTPFLGAGVNFGYLPVGRDIARKFSSKFKYPVTSERENLPRVAQFVATEFGERSAPKYEILELLTSAVTTPPYGKKDEPLTILSKLPFRIYITTNYDDLFLEALCKCTNKLPKQDICKWYPDLKVPPSPLSKTLELTKDSPILYHLHGHHSVPKSLVLTEDDFLDFLIYMARDEKFLPPVIQQALTGTLLFIGYRLADINFQVLFRGLKYVTSLAGQEKSVAVQLPVDPKSGNKERAENFITKYLGKVDVAVYWGNAQEFTKELARRWEKRYHEKL
jgi:hypothetical protein